MKPANLLVALCCIVWLHGCAATPRVIATPNVCPAKREKPLNLMQPQPDRLPALEDSLPKDATPAQKADALQAVRRESGRLYSECYESLRGLIDWIRAE